MGSRAAYARLLISFCLVDNADDAPVCVNVALEDDLFSACQLLHGQLPRTDNSLLYGVLGFWGFGVLGFWGFPMTGVVL